GVAQGTNVGIAWSCSVSVSDQTKIDGEVSNPANPSEYKVNGRWQRMKSMRETVRVKGRPDETLELRFTRHGPVLFQDDKLHRAYALKWAGSEPGGAAYLGGLAVSRAGNRSEFLDALKRWKVPGLNFVYADKE